MEIPSLGFLVDDDYYGLLEVGFLCFDIYCKISRVRALDGWFVLCSLRCDIYCRWVFWAEEGIALGYWNPLMTKWEDSILVLREELKQK